MKDNEKIDLKLSAKDNVVNVVNKKVEAEKEQKSNGFARVLHGIFVHNFALKAAALGTSIILFVIASGL